ncbi:unnamed protein product [Closterium sp. NIES-53]
MGEVGDASVFRVWGCRAFVYDTSAVKLSSSAVPCVFLGFPPDTPGLQFYHPTSRRVLPSEDVTFDKSVPFYRLFPYRTAPLPFLPLLLAPGPPLVDPLSPQGPAPSGVSKVDPLPLVEHVEFTCDFGAARDATSGGMEPAVAEPERAELGGAEPESAEPRGAEPAGLELGGAKPEVRSLGLREWYARRCSLWSGAAGAGGPGATSPGGARGIGGAGATSREGPTDASP